MALGRELSQEPDDGGMVFTEETGNLRNEEAEEVKEGRIEAASPGGISLPSFLSISLDHSFTAMYGPCWHGFISCFLTFLCPGNGYWMMGIEVQHSLCCGPDRSVCPGIFPAEFQRTRGIW